MERSFSAAPDAGVPRQVTAPDTCTDAVGVVSRSRMSGATDSTTGPTTLPSSAPDHTTSVPSTPQPLSCATSVRSVCRPSPVTSSTCTGAAPNTAAPPTSRTPRSVIAAPKVGVEPTNDALTDAMPCASWHTTGLPPATVASIVGEGAQWRSTGTTSDAPDNPPPSPDATRTTSDALDADHWTSPTASPLNIGSGALDTRPESLDTTMFSSCRARFP